MLTPKTEGVVALSVFGTMVPGSRKSEPLWYDFFIPVRRKPEGNGFLIELGEPFVPRDGKMGQIIQHHGLTVRIDNEEYGNMHTPGIQYVEDPNLLCQYLAGDVTADEVKAVAVRLKSEETELERARAVIEELSPLIELIPEMREREEDYHRTYLEAAEEFVHSGHLWHLAVRFKELEVRDCEFGFVTNVLKSYGLCEPGNPKLEVILPSIQQRVRNLVELVKSICNAYEMGRWGLHHRLGQDFKRYAQAAGEEARRFIPKNL
jgi:hypothetical protein